MNALNKAGFEVVGPFTVAIVAPTYCAITDAIVGQRVVHKSESVATQEEARALYTAMGPVADVMEADEGDMLFRIVLDGSGWECNVWGTPDATDVYEVF